MAYLDDVEWRSDDSAGHTAQTCSSAMSLRATISRTEPVSHQFFSLTKRPPDALLSCKGKQLTCLQHCASTLKASSLAHLASPKTLVAAAAVLSSLVRRSV